MLLFFLGGGDKTSLYSAWAISIHFLSIFISFTIIYQAWHILVLMLLKLYAGVAKSIVRVVRVVHLLLRTSNLFQLTCPWTSEKYLILGCLKNTILFPKVAANTNTHKY